MSTTLDELLQSLESDASGVEKQASDSTPNTNTTPGEQNEMSKEAAYEYGRALARELVKRANQITENDRAIQDVQASQVLPVPDGTVNDVLRGIMARDQERGFEDLDPDLEALLGRIAEGNADGHLSDEIRMALMGGASPEQRGTGKLIATESAADEVEKAAAVNALVDAGISFDDASELVKAAAEEAHYRPLVKKIVDEKEHPWGKPDLKEKLRRAYEDLGRAAKSKGSKIGAGVAGVGADLQEKLQRASEGLGRVAKSKGGKIGAGVAGAGALTGAAALAAHMYAQGKTDREDESEGEKAAAVSALVAAGLPFDDAAELVKAAAEDAHYRPLATVKKKIEDEGEHAWGKPGLTEKMRRLYESLGRRAPEVGRAMAIPAVAGASILGAGAAGIAADRFLNKKKEGEKAAAVDALVNAGLPFEDAASLVKAAAYELDKEASNDDLIAEILANLQG